MRILLVGGGTGGHFYPLIATAEAIRAREIELETEIKLFYMGPDIFDEPLLGKLSIGYVKCPAGKVRRYASIQNFFDAFKTIRGFFVALRKLFFIYPDVIFSKGSYTSVPVVLAAKILGIPVVIHESDVVPGRANKLAKGIARYIGITYPETAEYFDKTKTALIGMPIRKSFYAEPNPAVFRDLKMEPGTPYILFTTGSLGAERINTFVLQVLDELLPHYHIIHQAGKLHAEGVKLAADQLIQNPDLRARYHVFGNVPGPDFHALQSFANLIISRAGSTTISEIAFHQKPAILIPIPEAISHDQRKNAFAYARTGGASVMEEHNLTENLLVAEIERIMQDSEMQAKMRRGAESFFIHHAAFALADTLISIGKEHAR